MKQKNSKQQLNIIFNQQKKQILVKEQKEQINNSIVQNKSHKQIFTGPNMIKNLNRKDELKGVQQDIQVMKNKIYLLNQQLKKQQQKIKSNKSKTEQIIRKKINVNKIQRYKQKDNSLDIQRSQQLRIRNASLRQAHQSQMQNILKAIYLVKLDDARQIKNQSQNLKIKIKQMNDSIWEQQIQKKKKVAKESQKARQRYQKYWKQKLSSLYQNQNKNKQSIQKLVNNKKDQLKELRKQEIKLLQSMNKIQQKQIQSKKQFLAALSLPVKQIAQALNKSNISIQKSKDNDQSIEKQKMLRMKNDLIQIRKSKSSIDYNSAQEFTSLKKSSQREFLQNQFIKDKVPKSVVNPDKLKVILKQLKRLQKKQKNKQFIV